MYMVHSLINTAHVLLCESNIWAGNRCCQPCVISSFCILAIFFYFNINNVSLFKCFGIFTKHMLFKFISEHMEKDSPLFEFNTLFKLIITELLRK